MTRNFFTRGAPPLAPMMLVLLSLIAAIYAALQAVHFPFIADDNDYLITNSKLAALPAAELWRLLVEPYNPWEFLPLRDLSYWLDLTLFGLNPMAFRVHNIVLYVLCCLLVYVVTLGLWRYFRATDDTNARWYAAAVTALFTINPAHVEAVVWISGRKDLLSMLFALLALWLALRVKQKSVFSTRYAAGALLALLAAMLSKAAAVAVAPVIALLWIIFWRGTPAVPAPDLIRVAKPNTRQAADKPRAHQILLWSAAAVVLAAGMMLVFVPNSNVKAAPYWGMEVVTRALAIGGWLTRLAITPEGRHFFYPVFEDSWLPVMIVAGAAMLVAAVFSAVTLLRRPSLERYALVTFVLLCLPYAQLVPFETFSLVSDRFVALALWPLLLIIVALSWRLPAIPRIILLLAISLAWCWSSAERVRDWRSDEALIDAELRAYPGHYQPAFQQIIGILIPQALHGEASRLARQITAPEFRHILAEIIEVDAMRSTTLATDDPRPAIARLTRLGEDLKQMPAEAYWNQPMSYVWKSCSNIFALEWADLVAHYPGDALLNYRAGASLNDAQQYRNAIPLLRTAIQSAELPQNLRADALSNLGLALLSSGRVNEAAKPLQTAIDLAPLEPMAYCVLAEVYQRTSRPAEAERAASECSSRAGGRLPMLEK
ncbi:MAG: hypothetical protein V4443_10975 [Pseudomonadota bacterium]